MGSKVPKQLALTPEKQSRYEEDVKEIERCGPSAIQSSSSVIILESHPTRDSRFKRKINALQTQSLQPTQATVVPSDQTYSHNSLDQSLGSLESLTDELQQLEDAGKFIT